MPLDQTTQQLAELARRVSALESGQRQPTWTDILLAAVGVLTLLALMYYAKKTSDMVVEMKAAREADNRPYVVVHFDPFSYRDAIMFVVENTGHTAAKGLVLKCDPSLVGRSPTWNLSKANPLLWRDPGLEFLAPGQRINLPFELKLPDFATGKERTWQVEVKYWGPLGAEPYRETQTLDLTIFAGMFMGDPDPIVGVVDELEGIKEALNRLPTIHAMLRSVASGTQLPDEVPLQEPP
jgi:hypothetical protein